MTTIINALRNALITLANAILSILPDSPFQKFLTQLDKVPELGYLSYFLPIPEILAIFQAWLSAIIIFYAYQLVMRWIKLID